MSYLIQFENEDAARKRDCEIADEHFGGLTDKTTAVFACGTEGENFGLIVPSDEYEYCFTSEEWDSRITIKE